MCAAMKVPEEPKPPAAPVENQNFAGTYELDEAQFANQLVELAPTFALTESKFEKLTQWDSPIIQTAKALLIGNIALLVAIASGAWDDIAADRKIAVDDSLVNKSIGLLIVTLLLVAADRLFPNQKSKVKKEIVAFFKMNQPKLGRRK